MGRAFLTVFLPAALLTAIAGCGGPPSDDSDGGGDADGDAGPPPVRAVDILFVVDLYGLTPAVSDMLGEQFRLLAEELIWPTPDEHNQMPPALTDLHVGLVSSDLDEPAYSGSVCWGEANDARLLHEGAHDDCQADYSAEDCDEDACPWLSFSGGPSADGTPIWEGFACIAGVSGEDLGGCGGWQPFEAALGALTWRTGPGQPNDGFLRDEALLVVVFVHGRDDCSVADDAFYDELGEISRSIVCVRHAELLHPVERYYDRLTALKDHPGHVVVAAIVGVPVDGSWSPGDPIEDLRELQERFLRGQQVAACESSIAEGYAPLRFAELALLFGDNGSLASICDEDWTETMLGIAALVQRHLTI